MKLDIEINLILKKRKTQKPIHTRTHTHTHTHTQMYGHRKGSSKNWVYSNIKLPQEARTIIKQFNFNLKQLEEEEQRK